MNIPVLTIDGPSATGKGTISRAIATQLGWGYLDSGAIYRSLAIATIKQGIAITEVASIAKIAHTMCLEFDNSTPLIVKLEGVDISAELASEAIGNTAAIIATHPQIRTALLQKQKDFRQPPGLVADGRDMGTVVFFDAEKKVYLTASTEERGKRRYKQLIQKGISASLNKVTSEIKSRDRMDKERQNSPLKIAENALYIDSSELSIAQVTKKILDWVR